MPTWSSKAQVEKALTAARKKAKTVRAKHGGDSQQYKDAIKECVSLQTVLDKWDALHSRW